MTGGGCTTLRTPGLNEDASGKQCILVVRNKKRHQKQMQHMHWMHEFW